MSAPTMHTASMDLVAARSTAEPLPISLRERQLIDEPRLNKSTEGFGRTFVDDEELEGTVDDAMWFPDHVPS